MSHEKTIKPKDRDALFQSLRAGVVPRRGLHHVQVGRNNEIEALLRDVDRISSGGSAIRFIVGEYGSGKTFFLNLIRAISLEKKLVTLHADMTPDRRLHATGGQAQGLYRELLFNASTRTKPDGGALASIVERFMNTAVEHARQSNALPESVIRERMAALSEMVGGYDFADVIAAYWRGHDTGNEHLKAQALKWLRGEFTTKTDARKELGVRTIIDDQNVYEMLKLLSRFVRFAGYDGILVTIDEVVNLFKLSNTQARNSNYEQILHILNDCLQGAVEGLGFLFGCTPETVLNTRRGLYSYQALQSRLPENAFASHGLVDYHGPVLRLASLTPEDLYVLLMKLRNLAVGSGEATALLPDEGLTAFMDHCSTRIGESYFRTPRSTITAFVGLLSVLEQNPGADWRQLLGHVQIAPEENPDLLPSEAPEPDINPIFPVAPPLPDTSTTPVKDDDDLASFTL